MIVGRARSLSIIAIEPRFAEMAKTTGTDSILSNKSLGTFPGLTDTSSYGAASTTVKGVRPVCETATYSSQTVCIASARLRRKVKSWTTATRHGWRLPPLGAKRASSSISYKVESSTVCSVKPRTAPVVRMPSRRSISNAASYLGAHNVQC